MSEHEPAFEPEVLDSIVETGERVTLLRADGREFSGVIVATETPGVYKLATGKRGRPVRFVAQEIATLTVHVEAS